METVADHRDDLQARLEHAVTLHQSGRGDEAERLYRDILESHPDQPDALHLLGVIEHQAGHHAEAVNLIDRAALLAPPSAVLLNNLGAAYRALDALDEAEALFLRALELDPVMAEAHYNLGYVLGARGENEKAADHYRKALSIRPDYPDAQNNLGNTLSDLGHSELAMECFRKTIALAPDYAMAHNNLGNAYFKRAQLAEAEASFRNALKSNPDIALAHNGLGTALHELGRRDEAIECYRRAIKIDPAYATAWTNLGIALRDGGENEEAASCQRQALSIDPDAGIAAAELLDLAQHACAWHEVAHLLHRVEAQTEAALELGEVPGETPYANITRCTDPSRNFAVARAWSRATEQRMAPWKGDFEPPRKRSDDTRITVGYLSSNFGDHPVAQSLYRVFGLHDRDEFRVLAYSSGVDDGSLYRRFIEANSDQFIDIRGLGFQEAATRIRDDGVDILVDLNGYTQGGRMEICALRPAPVQVSFHGFPATTGASFMDFIITDRVVTPEDHAKYYGEAIAYLPHCNRAADDALVISGDPVSRTNFGLPEDEVVFASFNQAYKIEPVIFGVWMKLLKNHPDSVLWLTRPEPAAEKNIIKEASARGVPPTRLVFADRVADKEIHLARLALADMALDTTTFNGHNTTCDALFAGVPVVALEGTHYMSRMSASILKAAGVPELITPDLASYEALALHLSQQPEALSEIREKLQLNRSTMPLFDTGKYVKDLEILYQRIWRHERCLGP